MTTLVAGTTAVMWLGELITARGIGNGMSIMIFTQVVATFPASLWALKEQKGWGIFAMVLAIGMVIIAAVVFVEQGQRRIPVQYARRMVGRKMYGGSSTYIPLKVNQAGIIPVIFASSLLYLPVDTAINRFYDTQEIPSGQLEGHAAAEAPWNQFCAGRPPARSPPFTKPSC